MTTYAVYVVEFYLPRSRSAQARELAQQVAVAAGGDRPTRCLQVLSVPAEEYCLGVYEAESARIVEDAIRVAGLERGAAAVPALLHSDLVASPAGDAPTDLSRCHTAPPAIA